MTAPTFRYAGLSQTLRRCVAAQVRNRIKDGVNPRHLRHVWAELFADAFLTDDDWSLYWAYGYELLTRTANLRDLAAERSGS